GTLNNPQGVFSDGTRLFVADSGNHRVLIWNTMPSTTADADRVIGQSSMTATGANAGGISAATLSDPRSATYAAGKLWVADFGNKRVLSWDGIPGTDGE